jgi:hypothetical protein
MVSPLQGQDSPLLSNYPYGMYPYGMVKLPAATAFIW